MDTCMAVSDEVVIFGSESGQFWAYNRETLELFGRFIEGKNEFENNPITCMHIHPLRTEYVCLGYQGGQIVLVDLTQYDDNRRIKARKVIKDHH